MSKVHIQSKLLSRTPVIMSRPQVLSGTGSKKKKGGGGGTDCTGRYKGVRTVRPESVAGGGITISLNCY